MKKKPSLKDLYRKDKQVALRMNDSDFAYLEYLAERFGTSVTSQALMLLQRGITMFLVHSPPVERERYNEQHVKLWGEEVSLDNWLAYLQEARESGNFALHWTNIDPGEVVGHEDAVAAGVYSGSKPVPPEDGVMEMDDGTIAYRKEHPYTKQQKVILKKELQALRAQMEKMGEKIEVLERVAVESEE